VIERHRRHAQAVGDGTHCEAARSAFVRDAKSSDGNPTPREISQDASSSHLLAWHVQ
jgi:hypothetical protein